jgi:hypothetical protein
MRESDYKRRNRKRRTNLGEPSPKKRSSRKREQRNPVKVSQWNWRAKLTNINIPTT